MGKRATVPGVDLEFVIGRESFLRLKVIDSEGQQLRARGDWNGPGSGERACEIRRCGQIV